MAALSLAGAWIGTRDSVQLITMKPFRPSGATDLASLGRATAWLNSPPLTAAELQGKVVLVDFWTYTCINCLRTLPYLEAWDARYRREGLVIVGVHSPEFPFERGRYQIGVRRPLFRVMLARLAPVPQSQPMPRRHRMSQSRL
jgi:thiol-disulfide isomerase/thioredoxin